MLYTLGVLAFAFGLLASIALHEVGHLVPAQRFGVRVTQYMVGFGPTLWSRRSGETEYGLKAVPLGGYIRMIGMVPPRQEGKRSRWPGRMAELVEDFRATSRVEVTDADDERQFYRLTPGKKMVVMLGGPTMNLLIFFVITVVLYGAVGEKQPSTTIGAVSECVVPATATTDRCAAGATPAPAAGKLLVGDKVVAIGSRRITSWTQVIPIIEKSANTPLQITVERAGRPVTVTVTPVENRKYVNDTSTATKMAGFIGIGTTEHYVTLGPSGIASVVGDRFDQSLTSVEQFPAKIGDLWGTVFEGKPRDQAGAIGVVGLGRIGGQIASDKNFAVRDRIAVLFDLLAGVNLLLFLFNLLPLLPLDGGHVAGALVEAARRGWARLRIRRRAGAMTVSGGAAGDTGAAGTPAVGTAAETETRRPQIYVDVAQLVPVMYVVAGALALLSAFVLYADIVKPVSIN